MRLIDADKLKASLKEELFTEDLMVLDGLNWMKGFEDGVGMAIAKVENAPTVKHDDVNTERAKLLPCPFCGKDAAYITENKCLKNGFVSFSLHHSANGCVASDFRNHSVFSSEKDAADAWNRRVEEG